MAGGSNDWNTLLNHQRELAKEARGSGKYSKIAAITSIIGLIVGVAALVVAIFAL